jgi:hypothetical protein
LVLLTLLLVTAFGLGNDILRPEEDRYLSLESIIGMAAIFGAGYAIAHEPDHRIPLVSAFGLGIAGHIIALAIVPPKIVMREFSRGAGIISDPNILMLFILPTSLLLISILPRGVLAWLLTPLFLLGTLWATVQSLSRAALIAEAVALATTLLLCIRMAIKSRKRRSRVFAVLLASALLPVTLPMFWPETIDYAVRSFQRRFKEGTVDSDRTSRQLAILEYAGTQLLLPFGVGYPDGVPAVSGWGGYLAHNTFFDVLLLAGPFGLLAFLYLYVSTFVRLGRPFLGRGQQSGIDFTSAMMLVALLSQVVLLMTLSVLGQKVHWLCLGYIYGTAEICDPSALRTAVRRRLPCAS